MAYTSWSVVFGEQPSAAKWNLLGANDAYFDSIVGSGTAWTSWAGTVVGWSATTTAEKYYKQIGKNVWFMIHYTGTSNSTSVTFTLPVAAATGHVVLVDGTLGLTQDNGTVVAAGRWSIDTAAGTQVITCFSTQGGGGWNAANTKTVRLQGFYEAA